MMNKMRVVIIFVILVFFTASCSHKDDSTSKTLTLYTKDPGYVEDLVNYYNSSQDKYEVVVLDYSDEEDEVQLDIAAGNAPDLYDISNGVDSLSMSGAIEKKLFKDLKKEDRINFNDYNKSILNSMTTSNSEIYYIPDFFTIESVCALQSVAGSEPGWNLEEVLDLVDDSNGNMTLMKPNYSKSYILARLFPAYEDYFVDWETGKCNFDDKEFIRLLNVCNTGALQENDSEHLEFIDGMKNHSQLMFDINVGYQYLQALSNAFGDDLIIKGFPCESGSGTYFKFKACYAISESCENMEGALDFLRVASGYDYQSKYYYELDGFRNVDAMPTRSDVLDMYFEARKATESYTDEVGNYIEVYESNLNMDGYSVDLKPMTDKEADIIKHCIDISDGCLVEKSRITEIVCEEAEEFFNGSKSAEEVSLLIQNRVSIYVGENR